MKIRLAMLTMAAAFATHADDTAADPKAVENPFEIAPAIVAAPGQKEEAAAPAREKAPVAEQEPPPAQEAAAPTVQQEEAPPAAPAAQDHVPAALENDSPALREEGTDEVDLEEIDDSAEAAKKPSIRPVSTENVEYVDISCDEATLADILRQFRKTTKANIIHDDSTNLQKRVSVELKHVPWLSAMLSILNSRGFNIEEREGIYFVAEDKRVEPVVTKCFQLNHASADDLAALFNANYAPKNPNGTTARKIANSFAEANTVIVTANEKTIADCAAIVKAVDKAVAQIYIEARFLELSSAAMHSLGIDWSSLKSWGVHARGITAGATMNNGKSAYYGRRLSNLTHTGERTTTTVDEEGKSNKNITGSQATTTYEGIAPSEIGAAAGGAISAEDMAWRNAYGFSGQLTADEFSIALSAFESLGEGKIFSNPKIIVANGKQASVDMTTKEPNVSVDANYTGANSQNMSISTKIETIPGKDPLMFAGEAFFSYGITLSVKPRISPDGLINVEIVPTISQLDTTKGDNGYKVVQGASDQSVYTKYPIIEVKRLTTNFTMKDGATAVIGGLTLTTESDRDTGIPYLRKIPWIGPRLFGNKVRVKEQNEIIVFVTVGIANPGELPKDVGLPKNSILGREYVTGERLEPGDRVGAGAKSSLELDMTPLHLRENGGGGKGTVSITPAG